jgi:hypothetical protein
MARRAVVFFGAVACFGAVPFFDEAGAWSVDPGALFDGVFDGVIVTQLFIARSVIGHKA